MTLQIWQPASPDNGNPHASWLKEWRRQTAIWEQADDDSPEGQAAWAQREALARKLASVPASGIEGLAAQLAFMNEDLGDYIAGMVGSPINTALQVAAGVSRGRGHTFPPFCRGDAPPVTNRSPKAAYSVALALSGLTSRRSAVTFSGP